MTDTKPNNFARHLAEQTEQDEHATTIIVRKTDAVELLRLRTLVKRLFIIHHLDEMRQADAFGFHETMRGASMTSMMREIATLCGLMEAEPNE